DGHRGGVAARTAPAAVLVLLRTIGLGDGEDVLAREPAPWTAQGFEVVMPQPADLYRLVADRQAALARLIASAHAMADAPVWLVGPGPEINAALAATPGAARAEISGALVISVTSDRANCSESVFYTDTGSGAAPKL